MEPLYFSMLAGAMFGLSFLLFSFAYGIALRVQSGEYSRGGLMIIFLIVLSAALSFGSCGVVYDNVVCEAGK